MPNAEPEIIDDVIEDPQLVTDEPVLTDSEDQGDDAEQKRVPLSELVKQREKKQQALSEVDTLKREVESLRQQNNLQSLVIPAVVDDEPEVDLIPPNAYDFNDDDEWLAAQRKYNADYKQKLKADTEALVNQQLAERDQVAEQSKAEREAKTQSEQVRSDYLERADKLEAPDFLEKEDAVRKEVAPWFFDRLMSDFDNSEQLVYSLGGDIPKLIELVDAFDQNQLRGGAQLVRYAANLGKPNTGNLPEPDEAIKGGGGVSDLEAQISRLREQKLAGKLTMQQFMDKKRKLQSVVV